MDAPRNLRMLELLIAYADGAESPADQAGRVFHGLLLEWDFIRCSAVEGEFVPTELGRAWLQALLDVEPPHRTRAKGLPIDPTPDLDKFMENTRDRALELAIRADHGDGQSIVEQAVAFEAYLLAGAGAAATVAPSAASRLDKKLDQILWWIGHQQEEVSHMAAKLTDVQIAIAALSDKIASEASVIDSAVALIEGFKDRIAGLITPRTDPDTVQQINHLLDTVTGESDKLSAAVAAGTIADSETTDTTTAGDLPMPYADPSPKFDGTNGTDVENADYARGVADSDAGKAAADVPDADRSNQAYTDGYFNASRAALNAGIDQANAEPSVDPGTPDTIVPPSTVPPDAPADVPTPESVAGPDEQPPATSVDPGTPAV